MLSTMILSLTLIGQPASPSGRLDNTASGAAAAPVRKSGPTKASLDNRYSAKKTTAYCVLTPPNRCLRSVWEIRSDGPLTNPYGVVWVRLSSWSDLNPVQLKSITDYERNRYRR